MPGFRDSLKAEIEGLDARQLPLQEGLTSGSYTLDHPHTAMILGISEQDGNIRARVGIFYASVIAGCSCADDPTPVDEQSEYCEVQVDIDRNTADTVITLLE